MSKSLKFGLRLVATLTILSLPLTARAAEPTTIETTPPAATTPTVDRLQVAPAETTTAPAEPTLASLSAEIAQNPKDAENYLQRGVFYAKLSQNMPAIADYTEAIRLNPSYELAYNNRAIAKLNLKDYQGAYQDFSQVLKLHPDKAAAYNNRAFARHRLGDCKGAILDLQIAARLFLLQDNMEGYRSTLESLKPFQRKKGKSW